MTKQPLSLRLPILALLLAGLLGAMAHAQDQTQTQETPQGDTGAAGEDSSSPIIDFENWNPEELYESGGFLATDVMGGDVYGPDGNEIGIVSNLVIDQEEKIIGVIAEVGGFWDLGDTHVAIPWSETSLSDDGLQTPIEEDNLEKYDLYGELSFVTKDELQRPIQVGEDVATGPRTWKITSLLDDYASMRGGIGYGYVDDIIFSGEGKIQAVVVQVRGADYAYPFYGYQRGWHPGYNTYVVPYDEDEVAQMPSFDEERFREESGG